MNKIKFNINIDDLNCILNRLENLELQYKHQKDNIKQIIYKMNKNNDDLAHLLNWLVSTAKNKTITKKLRLENNTDKAIGWLQTYNIYNVENLIEYLKLNGDFKGD